MLTMAENVSLTKQGYRRMIRGVRVWGGNTLRPASYFFSGFSSFQGSLTLGIVAISTLASLPSTFSALRI